MLICVERSRLSVKAFTVTLNSHNNAMCIGSVTIMLCVGACSNKCVIVCAKAVAAYMFMCIVRAVTVMLSVCVSASHSDVICKGNHDNVILYVRAITIM